MLINIVSDLIEIYVRKGDSAVDPRLPAAVRRVKLRLDFRAKELAVMAAAAFGIAQQTLSAIWVAAGTHRRCLPVVSKVKESEI